MATFTQADLEELVLNHLMKAAPELLKEADPIANRFLTVLKVSLEIAADVAQKSMVNRCHLSDLPTFDMTILANPEQQEDDASYELRYRITEQIGQQEPHLDRVLSKKEALEEWGEAFVKHHWGLLGEHCPRQVTAQGERNIWFSVVRYPVCEQSFSQKKTFSKQDIADPKQEESSPTAFGFLNPS